MAAVIDSLTRAPNRRKRFELVRAQLESERSPYLDMWRDVADHVLPWRPKFALSDTNSGPRRSTKILDGTATFSARTISSGMMGGITNPARPWKRLGTPDPDLNEFGSVKNWLHTVNQRMDWVFQRSNLYNTLPIIYLDTPTFATGAILVEKDADDVVYTKAFPIGSYSIACDRKGRVNTFYREFRMTIRQIVETFGILNPESNRIDWSNLSTQVRNLWDNGMYESWIDVRHIIMPNPDWNPKRAHSKFKRFLSCYYEAGTSGTASSYLSDLDEDKYLREAGYDYFPVLATRWSVSGEDPYGTGCPGFDSLGDIRQLQNGELRIAEVIDKQLRPPMTGPSALLTRPMSVIPGSFTADDSRDGRAGYRAAFQVDSRLDHMEHKQEQVRRRIQRFYFEDLFLMLTYSDRNNVTATEIEKRHEEKLLVLGPVLSQLNQDLLNPLIDIVFGFMLEMDLIPEAPEELSGMDLNVEYISIMAQAQKLVGVSGLERFAAHTLSLAAVNPQVLHKWDMFQHLDEYADSVGVSPRVTRTDEQVEEILAQEAQARAQEAQAMQMREMAGTAKDLSGAEVSDTNALGALLNSASGGGAVGAGGLV